MRDGQEQAAGGASPALAPLRTGQCSTSTQNYSRGAGHSALLHPPHKTQEAGQLESSPVAGGSQACVSRWPVQARELQMHRNEELATVIRVLIRMERRTAHSNRLPSPETQGRILFHFSVASGTRSLPLSSTANTSHQAASSLKQPQEINRVSSGKRRAGNSGQTQQEHDQGNGGCEPEFGPVSTTDGVACVSQSMNGTSNSVRKMWYKRQFWVVPRMLICICIRPPKKRELADQICNFTDIFP